MKIISQNHFFVNFWYHGYFVAKKHLKGKLIREVYITFFDTNSNRTSRGYLFISTNSCLIYLSRFGENSNVLLCIEKTDTLQTIKTKDKLLTKVLNKTPGSDKNISIKTTNPKTLLELNDSYLIIPDIQVDLAYGKTKKNFNTTYFVDKNDYTKVSNLITVIKNILYGKKYENLTPISGISRKKALTIIYSIFTTTVLFTLLLLYFSLNTFLG